MIRRLATLLSILVAVAQPQAQRPDWPQPIVKGTAIVWGSEKATDAAMAAFKATVGAEDRILVFAQDSEAAKARWKDTASARFVTSLTTKDFEGVKAVWLEKAPDGSAVEALVKLKQSGGTVALPLELFSLQAFSVLLPHVGTSFAGEDGTNVSSSACQIDEGAVLVAAGRDLGVRGEGSVKFLIAGAKGGSADEVSISGRHRADLVALRRRAIDHTLPDFPPKTMPRTEVKSGTLFIVGGGGIPEDLLQKFIDACGGPDAPIVYVPCEFAEEIAAEPSFVRLLRSAGARKVTWIHTKDRIKADKDEEFLKPLKEAKGVWFGGGRQWNLVDSYMDTRAHDLMRQVLQRGGAIGGSSAGASIQAEFLARGDPLGNLNIIAPGYTRGLGFLPGAAVDQHFSQRDRHKDMTLLMQTYPQLLGIGIDEATAIIVNGATAEVTGRGQVFFYDWSHGKPEGDTDFTALKAGDKYDLAQRKKSEGERPLEPRT